MELPFCKEEAGKEAVGGGEGVWWFKGSVPITTSSRGSRGGRDLEKAATSLGSRLVVEDILMAFSSLSLRLVSPPGRDREERRALGIGRSRE